MSEPKNDTYTQLMMLRGLTKTTGMLHEAQVLQLKHWPRIAIPHSTYSEFGFSHEKHVVEFRVKTKGKAPKDLKLRLGGLAESVRDLLGPEYTVRVKDGKKKLFESKGQVPVPKKETRESN
jgi:hypothetical protein